MHQIETHARTYKDRLKELGSNLYVGKKRRKFMLASLQFYFIRRGRFNPGYGNVLCEALPSVARKNANADQGRADDGASTKFTAIPAASSAKSTSSST